MGYWDEDFYEPSEFDKQVEEWKELLRNSVKKEYQDEMEQLRKENQELREIKNSWSDKVRELEREKESAKRESNIAIKDAEINAKRTRLYELLKPFLQKAYAVQYEYKYIHEKCDKCDEKGYVHFKSPSGRDMTEQCACRERKCFYFHIEVEEFELSQFITKYDKLSDFKIIYIYKRDKLSNGNEKDCFCSTSNIYNGQDFSIINRWSGMIFFDKEDIQKYCDYLNKE